MAHQLAWPFNQPVDPVALNIPDYLDIIKQPMDLGTIKVLSVLLEARYSPKLIYLFETQRRLEDAFYTSINDFASDVRLVWKNAMTYNPPGSDVYVMADVVSKAFESKFGKLAERIQKEEKERREKEKEKEKRERKEKSTYSLPPFYL